MAGALQAQVLLPFTHQQPDVPRPEEVLWYYSADNLRGLWAYWEGRWYASGDSNAVSVSTANTSFGGGGILQTLAINRRFDWNAGGGDDRNGSVSIFNPRGGDGTERKFWAGISTDSDGRHITFESADGWVWGDPSNNEYDGLPPTLGPANSGGNDIEAYPGSYALSYGLWFKYRKSNNGSSSSRQPIGNLAGSNPPSGQVKVGWYIDDSDSKLRAVRRDSSGNFTVAKTFDFAFSEETLYCLVLTMATNGNIKMYVDGTLEDSYTESNTINEVGYVIGNWQFDGQGDSSYTDATFCGRWYKSCWWKIVLSSTEVDTFYDNGSKSPAIWAGT